VKNSESVTEPNVSLREDSISIFTLIWLDLDKIEAKFGTMLLDLAKFD